ncbi:MULTISPECIES: TspO/MBR family protein [Niastella]|uniref:Tryptophan-rich sensory protein n=1 Tax=Niastella soli TaxID=2821487 RepID=A0ABS3YYA1_9BACT|nr:TspO/MBR family protein [Niastella soli]MBO9202136.1 tryptophan-rich sensory protein [Niastella soli]
MQLEQTGKQRRLKWWQLALLSIVVTALGGLSGRRSKKSERALYNEELKQAPWAPPAWVFGPAWTVNNFFVLQALKKLVQETGSHRKKLLTLQVFIWIIFFSFNYIYFKRKSTGLAFLWTMVDTMLAASSFTIALRQNKQLAWRYLPLLGWTGYASSLAGYQALENSKN